MGSTPLPALCSSPSLPMSECDYLIRLRAATAFRSHDITNHDRSAINRIALATLNMLATGDDKEVVKVSQVFCVPEPAGIPLGHAFVAPYSVAILRINIRLHLCIHMANHLKTNIIFRSCHRLYRPFRPPSVICLSRYSSCLCWRLWDPRERPNREIHSWCVVCAMGPSLCLNGEPAYVFSHALSTFAVRVSSDIWSRLLKPSAVNDMVADSDTQNRDGSAQG